MKRIVYYNGVFAKENETGISISNRGLLYGDGVFETFRAYSGRVFRLAQHLQRLFESLHVLQIEPGWKTDELERTVYELLKKNLLSDASMRVTVTRGDGEGPEPAQDIRASLFITAKQFNHYQEEDYKRGVRAHLVSIRRNIYSPLSRIKSLNYLDNILGRLEARENNAREAVFLNTEGWVAEGSVSNIFVVKGETLITPPVDAGILPGITREVVLEIASHISLKTVEQTFSFEVLLHADEAFLTNSLMEIMPLVSVNNKPIGSGAPGPITKQLRNHYRQLVQTELGLSV